MVQKSYKNCLPVYPNVYFDRELEVGSWNVSSSGQCSGGSIDACR
jgi:hypothetical protein